MNTPEVRRRHVLQMSGIGLIGFSAPPVSAIENNDTITGENLGISPPNGDVSRYDYIGKIEYNGEEYLSDVRGSPRLPQGDSFEFENRDELKPLKNDTLSGYRAVDQYTAKGTPLKMTSEVAINKKGNNGIISITVHNNGNEPVEVNTPSSYIGQEIGTVILRLNENKRDNNYRFHVSENTTEQFDDVGRWDTYDISGDIPYVMVFTDEFAFAIGQYEGTTDVEMAMTEFDPPSAIRIFVGSVVLESGESASWEMGFAGFENNGSTQTEAQQLLSDIENVNFPSDYEQEDNDTDGESDTVVEVPGFGIGSALVSLGGAGYVLKRRLDSEDD